MADFQFCYFLPAVLNWPFPIMEATGISLFDSPSPLLNYRLLYKASNLLRLFPNIWSLSMASSSSAANSLGTSSSVFLSACGHSLSPQPSPPIMVTPCPPSPSFIDPPLFPATNVHAVGSSCSVSSNSERRKDGNDSDVERLRSCDVYVGYCGHHDPLLMRFVKWLHAEMVMNGFSCFVSNRARCSDGRAHAMARTAMEEATLGVLIITRKSFSSPWSVEELNFLLGRKNLIPIFFGLKKGECLSRDIVEKKGEIWSKYGGTLWKKYGGLEGEWSEAVDGLSRLDVMLEVSASNMRDCVLDAILLISKRLGRRDAVEKMMKWKNEAKIKEFPFTRNPNFIGRKNELLELKLMLFGDSEIDGDNAFINLVPEKSSRRGSELHQKKNMGKMKEPKMWKESKEEIEMEYKHNIEDADMFILRKHRMRSRRKMKHRDLALGKGIACISGESGTGKTELLLEFAYRHSQMYKVVLWISGEARYVRINYMNLLPLLGIDVSIIDNELRSDRTYPVNFEETEAEVIRNVRKEFMRGIPFLLVIDNLESEKDWWDGRKIMELLPRFGGETHILISTRLCKVMNIQTLKLFNLSSAEAMSLMAKSLRNVKVVELNALKVIEERLGRLSFGLGLVGAILSDYSLDPSKLLEAINRMPRREIQWNGKEGAIFRHYPFLVQLLDFLILVFIQRKKHGNSAMRLVQVSGWFAPSPVPISLLALATEVPKERASSCFWKSYIQMFRSRMMTSHANLLKTEAASNMLISYNLARCCPRKGYISFHDIIKTYAYKNGGDRFASPMFRAVSIRGCLHEHLNHIWAACFLLFKMCTSPTVVNLGVPHLLSFIRQFVMPLSNHSFATLSQCDLILDLLRHSAEALESVENLILADASVEENMPFCFSRRSRNSTFDASPLIYQDLVHLRATVLETRAKFMLLCGQYEIGEQLCRTAINIKEVIYGWEHSETLSARKTMERFLSLQPSSQQRDL